MIEFTSRLLNYIVPLLICCILMSCSVSSHLGKTTVEKPTIEETSEQVWFLYFQDQFDGNGGKVEAPNDNYSRVAHEAYQKALQEWTIKFESVSYRNLVVAIIVLGAMIVAYLLSPRPTPGGGFGSWR